MRLLAWTLLLLSSLLLTSGREPQRRIISVSTADELMAVCQEPLENVTVKLAPGTYVLPPTRRIQTWDCGVVSDRHGRDLMAALVLYGTNVHLQGANTDSVIISSDADFRVYFNHCQNCAVDRMTILTGRPHRTYASGGGVLVTRSSVRISNCVFRDGPPEWSGETGVIATRLARLDMQNNEMYAQGCGIVLFDDAYATVRNNLVVGTIAERSDSIQFAQLGAIMACEARGIFERNLFKGSIVLMARADITFRANIVETGGGIDGSAGLGSVRIEQNVFYQTEGISMTADGDQTAGRNFLVDTNDSEPIRISGGNAEAANRKNTLYANNAAGDVPHELFRREQLKWTRTYRNTPVGVDGRHKFHESEYLQRYGRWLN